MQSIRWSARFSWARFDTVTRIVGLGGLLLSILFFRPKGYRTKEAPLLDANEGEAAYPAAVDLN